MYIFVYTYLCFNELRKQHTRISLGGQHPLGMIRRSWRPITCPSSKDVNCFRSN